MLVGDFDRDDSSFSSDCDGPLSVFSETFETAADLILTKASPQVAPVNPLAGVEVFATAGRAGMLIEGKPNGAAGGVGKPGGVKTGGGLVAMLLAALANSIPMKNTAPIATKLNVPPTSEVLMA